MINKYNFCFDIPDDDLYDKLFNINNYPKPITIKNLKEISISQNKLFSGSNCEILINFLQELDEDEITLIKKYFFNVSKTYNTNTNTNTNINKMYYIFEYTLNYDSSNKLRFREFTIDSDKNVEISNEDYNNKINIINLNDDIINGDFLNIHLIL